MKKYWTKEKTRELIYVTIGAFILAVSINSLLLPSKIVAGGANGISIIINSLWGFDLAIILYAINIPLLLLCFLLLGKEVGMKTIYGSLVYPFFVGITANIPVLTHNQLLAAIFGGVVTGVGLGLEFKGNASTGGTAIISQVVHVYLKVPLGVAVSCVDGLVILSAFLVFNPDTVLYSLICLFIIGRVVDLVQVSFDRSKNVLVISEAAPTIQKMILTKMDRGLTEISVKGGYGEHQEKTMLMCVLPEKEFHLLQEEVLTIDPHAFVVAMPASEVMGRGFSLSKIVE